MSDVSHSHDHISTTMCPCRNLVWHLVGSCTVITWLVTIYLITHSFCVEFKVAQIHGFVVVTSATCDEQVKG